MVTAHTKISKWSAMLDSILCQIKTLLCSGSEEERKVFEKANHHNRLAQTGEEPGLHIKIRVTPEMQIGSDFDVYAELKNNTMVTKACRVMFYAQAVTYNGKLGETCGLGEFTEMTLASTEGKPEHDDTSFLIQDLFSKLNLAFVCV